MLALECININCSVTRCGTSENCVGIFCTSLVSSIGKCSTHESAISQ